ncbi:MAG TPA: D-aminoacylase [Candidatus Acidoferrales bacterium]|nr:D-aminoacylase [Candidatus Acidoferrales bacterium]
MALYDIVIHGGAIVDGTGNPWFFGDIAVKDGRIAAIGKIGPAEGARAISAKERVVAPGFIDMHTHSDQPLIADGNAQSKVRQGVTLDIIGESQTVAPLAGHVLEEYRFEHRRRHGIETDWTDFTGYFSRLLEQGISINVASGVSPQQIKRLVVGFNERPATRAEREEMNRLVARAMEEGALGLTCAWHAKGPENPDEVVEMAKVARAYGGYYGVHLGSEGFDIMEELEKAIRVGREADIPVHVYHLKMRAKSNWGRVREVVARIEEARREGLEITANQYPYTAMQHPWRRLFPRWVQNAPLSETIPQFRSPEFRARVMADAEFEQYVNEHGGWEGIVGARFDRPELKQFEGKTIAEIARIQGKDPATTCFDLIFAEGVFVHGVHHTMCEDDVRYVMRVPWVSIGSDGSALNLNFPGKPHPRSYGTNVRVLGRYARDERVLALEDAVRKMTSLPAQVLRLRDRGLIREGYWADLVVFDPGTVADTATYDSPKQYPRGVDYVLVNGVVVIDGGEHTGARPGRVVYGPGKIPA